MSRDYSNPIVMFGNIGPDVVRLSQIYDPDNDQYKPSDDQYAVLSPKAKRYWTRSYSDKVVKFTEVKPVKSTDTPKANGWYDENTNGIVSTGKYVPAERSLVVVDVEDSTYKENMVLTVRSVDDEITLVDGVRHYPTFKSTLVPVHYGTGTETSARSLDYGNDRFMLYFERMGDEAGNVRLLPDRKLQLYGDKYYVYRIVRNNSEVLSADKKTDKYVAANEGYIPFVGALDELMTITPEDFENNKYEGQVISVFSGKVLKRFSILTCNEATKSSFASTLDGFYRSGKTYYQKVTAAPGTVSFKLLSPATDYTIGDTVGDIFVDGAEVAVDPLDICQTVGDIFSEDVTGWLTHDSSRMHVYYPDGCWLQSPSSTPLAAGEIVTFEVYELNDASEFRLIMSTNLIVREGVTFDAGRASSKAVARFDVKLSDKDESDTFVLSQRSSTAELASKLEAYIVYDTGDKEIVKIDNESCFCYGLDAISLENPGRTYTLLFKYFRNVADKATSNTPKTFLSCTKQVVIANDASDTVRRISIVPCWDYTASRYVFKYLVYDNEFGSPEFRDNLDRLVPGTATDAVGYVNCFYKDEDGFVRPTSSPASVFDYVQRGDIAIFVRADGYSDAVFSQTVGLKLKPWTEGDASTNPAKWLIGDDKESTYSASVLKYGNTTDLRPYLNFFQDDDGAGGAGDRLFQIGNDFLKAGDISKFIKSFYTNGWTVDSTPATPTHVRFRGLGIYTHYDSLGSEVALRGVRYYNKSGIEVPVAVGSDVSEYSVRRQGDLTYYTVNAVTGAYVTATGLPAVGELIDSSTRDTLYLKYDDSVCSDYISLTDTSAWRRKFRIPGAKSVLEIDGTVGGAIPCIVDAGTERWNVQVMGLVVAEFSALGDDGVHKHLYGTPVEVRWPYVVTTDSVFNRTTLYYTYNPDKGKFDPFTDYTVGDPIPHEDGVKAIYVAYN